MKFNVTNRTIALAKLRLLGLPVPMYYAVPRYKYEYTWVPFHEMTYKAQRHLWDQFLVDLRIKGVEV
jgi:hypothetical protein